MNTIQQQLPADWPIDTVAYFAVDYDGGSDANLGFSLVSMAAAGAAPMKTLQQLFNVFPKMGNGRIAVIAIKPRAAGATYRNKANTADDDLDLRGVLGYRRLIVARQETAREISSPTLPQTRWYLAPSKRRWVQTGMEVSR